MLCRVCTNHRHRQTRIRDAGRWRCGRLLKSAAGSSWQSVPDSWHHRRPFYNQRAGELSCHTLSLILIVIGTTQQQRQPIGEILPVYTHAQTQLVTSHLNQTCTIKGRRNKGIHMQTGCICSTAGNALKPGIVQTSAAQHGWAYYSSNTLHLVLQVLLLGATKRRTSAPNEKLGLPLYGVSRLQCTRHYYPARCVADAPLAKTTLCQMQPTRRLQLDFLCFSVHTFAGL